MNWKSSGIDEEEFIRDLIQTFKNRIKKAGEHVSLVVNKAAVEDVFLDLLDKNDITTSLDVKHALRGNGYIAFQSDVSRMMRTIADEHDIPFHDNGTYREYYKAEDEEEDDGQPVVVAKVVSIVTPPTAPPQPIKVTAKKVVDDEDEEEDEVDKSSMKAGEVRFHMEEDGSYGSVRFKRLCKDCPEKIVITVENLGTEKAKASYTMTFSSEG